MKPNLDKEKLSILFLLASVFAAACFPLAKGKLSWMATGIYVTYEQSFAWYGHSEVANMTWQITKMEGDQIVMSVTSHTINVSDSNLEVVLVSGNFTINSGTREVISSSEPTMTGSKWPFWIETDVMLESVVDTGYGVTIISGSEEILALGQQRDTWIVEHDWSITSHMKRWYDKASGIVLKIQVAFERANIIVQVTETAKWTNLNLPSIQPNDSGLKVPFWVLPLAVASVIVVVSIGLLVTLKLKKRQGNQNSSAPKTTLGLQFESFGDS